MKPYHIHFCTIIAFAATLTSPLQAEEPAAAKEVAKDFTAVAKKAIPAIVSIQVKMASSQGGFNHPRDEWEQKDDPFGFFNDDFFRHFFNTPRRQQQQERFSIAQGSGFLVSEDGYILTNNHVINNAAHIGVKLNNGKEYDASVIGQDPNTDLAVIKIDAKGLSYLPLGNSDNLEVGQWVIAIGNPLGLQASLTVGVVSAKGRSNLDIARIEDFIQTDAAINRGNSGGPLLNLNSEVVGINTAIASNMGGYMGIGFAIPSNMAQHVMDELISQGSVSRGFLGVNLQGVDQDLAQAFGLNSVEGALITDIAAGSPAATADIKQGDIIIAYNERKVSNISGLRNAISMMKPGTKVMLTLLRDGKTLTVPVNIGEYPDEDDSRGGGENSYGFDVETITPEIAKNLDLLEESGVVVSKVKPGSPAAWIGIKKGALIIAVNKEKVKNSADFYKALKKTQADKPLLLLIKQDGASRYLSLKIG